MKTKNNHNVLSKEAILDFIRSNKKVLERDFGVTKIALFGSYARDEATPESDIDLLISTSIETFRNRIALRKFLENEFQVSVDVGYFESIRSLIYENIEKDLIYA